MHLIAKQNSESLIVLQLHDVAVKKQADDKRRAERKQRHLQDDLRYALKKVAELHDANLSYDDVSLLRMSF